MRTVNLIIFLILLFAACRPEDEEPQDYIELDGKKYELGTCHVSYFDRLNDAGELNHFYQIQVFGKNYQVQFDSEGNYYNEKGDDIAISIFVESKQAFSLENTFYQNIVGGGRDTTSLNEYSNLSLYNFEESSLMMDYQKIGPSIYLAMENRQLEILVENIKFYSNYSISDSTARKVNIRYHGRYHYSD
mgnify:CR=1 FL=1